jgi:3-hydroxyacyl-CoA dehydrogenase
MRWGFGMQQGPFELWQEAGWLDVAKMIQEDIDAGKALCKAPLPEWVFKGPVAEAGGVHTAKGSWSASARAVRCRAAHCRSTRASISPRRCAAKRCPISAQTAGTTAVRGRRDPPVDAGRRSGDRQHQDQDARDQHGGAEGLERAVELAEKSYQGW